MNNFVIELADDSSSSATPVQWGSSLGDTAEVAE
jgi:hypothetical protein